jgi:hypothetical protein
MAKKKHPYIGYSEEDVATMESHYFVLQLGDDFMSTDGTFLFNKNKINKLYNKTLKNLMNVVANGSDRDKKRAIKLISSLIIKPMRLH